MQAALESCLVGTESICRGLLEQLKADAKLAVKQALKADGPFELSPQASCLLADHTCLLHQTTDCYAVRSLGNQTCCRSPQYHRDFLGTSEHTCAERQPSMY